MCCPCCGILHPADEEVLTGVPDLEQCISAFLDDSRFTAKPFGSGHINSTYRITTADGEYILQRINHHVFPRPDKVMENGVAVTEHLRKKGSNALTFLRTKEGSACFRDQDGNYWRMYEFIPGLALDAPEKPEDLYQAGVAFGQFQALLADFPSETLYPVIPRFHDTPHRYEQLRAAITADRMGRASAVTKELDWLFSQEILAGTLQRMADRRELPLRVTHNDTKLNNVLLDAETGKPLCILDLDTVMPGLSAFDFGDAIRFGAATNHEDAPHNSIDLQLFRMYAEGYLQQARNLTENEYAVLCLGAFIMTLEVGMRFLTDYLDGDRYFKIAHPEHNLLRARNQLALAADILDKLPQMEGIIQKIRTSV